MVSIRQAETMPLQYRGQMGLARGATEPRLTMRDSPVTC